MKKDVAASAAEADKNEIVVYQPEGGEFHIEVRVENESVWLNRQQMAILFGRDVKTIGKHIANALKEELKDIPTVANFATVQNEGGRDVRRNVEHYNLDVIISVGYRVKSINGVKFRQWANQVLRNHLLRGYSINHRMLAMGVSIKIFSEQHGHTRLTGSMLADFRAARPDVELGDIHATGNIFHDRYIYLDFGTASEKLFHCGASSKDGGNKITTIMQLEDIAVYRPLFEKLLQDEK